MTWSCDAIHKGRWLAIFGARGKRSIRAEFEAASLSQLPWLYTCAYYLTQTQDTAEDLVQETYLQAYRRFSTREAETNLRVWLLCILNRIFIRKYREQAAVRENLSQERWSLINRGTPVNEATREEDTIQGSLISAVTRDEVEEAVIRLPEDHRLALILVDIEELSYQDAARVMECSLSTFRSKLSQARGMIQAALRSKGVGQRDAGRAESGGTRTGA
ncbi:MAG: sigma-70 family RNA polymerase sigma factor [Deltaproteobacteria bacterium]|nr:sigma-70 family RNA polymerase sigma factor [Deltaproteobacteria bacterium]